MPIVLGSLNLRLVILAVPPVVPSIRGELHISYSFAGILTSIPVLALAIGAIPGALLVTRYGIRAVGGIGLLTVALGAVVRVFSPQPAWLLVGTVVLSLGAAAVQPAVAAAIRLWFPGSLQRASALTTSLLYTGGIVGASATGYLITIGGWRGTFLIWSIPALLAATVWLATSTSGGTVLRGDPIPLTGRIDRGVWTALGLFGTAGLAYYGASSWIPVTFQTAGPHYVALVLLTMNAIQIPGSLLLITASSSWATSRAFYMTNALLATVGGIGMVLAPPQWAWLFAALFGLGGALVGSGALALPVVLARSEAEAATNTAVVLAGGYAISILGPFLGGQLVDVTGITGAALWPMAAATVLTLLIVLTIPSTPASARSDGVL